MAEFTKPRACRFEHHCMGEPAKSLFLSSANTQSVVGSLAGYTRWSEPQERKEKGRKIWTCGE